MRRVVFHAIVAGALVDMGTSAVSAIPLIVFTIISRGLIGMPPDKMQAALQAAMRGTAIDGIQLFLGLSCTVLGAYVAGRLAKHDEILNGLLAALATDLLGIPTIIRGDSHRPLWFQLLIMIVVAPLCGLLGGYLASLRARGRQARMAAAQLNR
jgi:hypothetical protein